MLSSSKQGAHAMRPEDSFVRWQQMFAARIRDPRGKPRPPGVPARRLRVYETLLFSNLESFLLACFPVTRRILGARLWLAAVRAFFRDYRCTSPLFRDIPAAFLDWVRQGGMPLSAPYPFLADLMHYEWLELKVETTPEDVGSERVNPAGDLMEGRPALNPTVQLACYDYPVHRIGPRFRPKMPDGVRHCYLVYRDSVDRVRFIVLNVLTARLVALLRQELLTGREALLRLAENPAPDALAHFCAAGQAALEDLLAQEVVLGVWEEEP